MEGYTKLFSSIITSTIWREDDKTRILWITMLALRNSRNIVEGSIPGLADMARMTIAECEAALAKLLAPDAYSRTKDNDGRRIAAVDGGWLILNGEKYREKQNEDERREYFRLAQQRHREKQATLSKTCQQTSTNVNNVNTAEQSRVREEQIREEKIAVPAAKARPPQPTQRKVKLADDADWFAGIKEAYAKLGVDADAEAIRARAWLTTPKGKGRKFTQQFFANWLSRCDRNTCSGDKPPADPAERQRQRTQADTAALASYADELLAIRAEEQQPDLTDERKGYITDCASRLFKKIKDNFGVEGIGKVKLLVLERNKI